MEMSRMMALNLLLIAALIPVNESVAQNGILLGAGRIGVNFNNRYVDGPSKTDWIEFGVDENDQLLQGIADLSNLLDGDFKVFRCGWSRNMGLDLTDLNEWVDGLETIINAGNEVMVVFWGAYPPGGPGKISDPQGDAVLWEQTVDLIEARGLLHGVVGWEIMNEPNGNGDNWGNYVRTIYKNVGPYDNVAWADLTPQQFADTAAAWHNKPIVVQGTGFGQNFPDSLQNRLEEIANLVWSSHHYSMFTNITAERENWTVEQWRDFLLDDWADRHQGLDQQLIVTEMGNSNSFFKALTGMGPAGTTADNRRDAGFIRAARKYYGLDTTIFWYTAYNTASIGIGELFFSGWNNLNLETINYVFNGVFEPVTNGVTNVALNKPIAVSSERNGQPGTAAVDGNKVDNGSRWLSGSGIDFPHTIEIDLLNAFAIRELRLYTGFNNKFEKPVSDFELQRFHNGVWEEVVAVTGNNNPALRVAFEPVVADRVRLVANSGLVDEIIRVYELEIYGSAPVVGEPIAAFDFTDGSSASTDTSNLSAVSHYDTSIPNVLSGDDSGVSSINDNAFLRAENTPDVLDPGPSNLSYHQFEMTIQNLGVGQSLDLTTIEFDYGPTTNGAADGSEFSVGLFSDRSGYLSDTNVLVAGTLQSEQNDLGTFVSHDLRFLGNGTETAVFRQLVNGETVQFRLYFADNTDSNSRIHRVDNLRVHGVVNESKVLLGDVNCDGLVDLLDVGPFVDLVTSGGFSEKADINGDGLVNLLDVGPFVALLTGG